MRIPDGLRMPAAWPLLTAAETRAAEQAWFAAGHDSFELMRRAAKAVADEAATMLAAGDPGETGAAVLVLAGPGNNGGDGYVAASLLRAAGHRVRVVALAPPASEDARRAAALWGAETLGFDAGWGRPDLVIDALFGTGLGRPPAGAAAALIGRASDCACPILAVDMPSGVDSDSGAAAGAAIRASRTVTFHSAKPGHLLLPGRLLAGELRIADIGLPPADSRLWGNGPGPWELLVPQLGVHKYARGGALVWSGPELMTGASRLAASAALRVGAGAVTIAGDVAALRVHAAHVTAIMLAEAGPEGFGRLAANPRVKALCVGPGGGPFAGAAAVQALQSGKAVVLDADSLSAFAGDVAHLARLVGRHPRAVVLTPHEGEFNRLFPDMPGNRLERARRAADSTGAVVVLKGADGCIAAADGRAAIACNTEGFLATAGSGDVLAGMIAGLLAQGLDGFEAAGAASWLHGEVGARLGLGLTAEDLCGDALRQLLSVLG